MARRIVPSLVLLAVVALPQSGYAKEKRCGWFENPTPSNAWLTDKDGEWIVGVQGGYQAEGDWPLFSDKQWVETNVHYGYGCACMEAEVDHATQHVQRIIRAEAKPLSACRKDKALTEPKVE